MRPGDGRPVSLGLGLSVGDSCRLSYRGSSRIVPVG